MPRRNVRRATVWPVWLGPHSAAIWHQMRRTLKYRTTDVTGNWECRLSSILPESLRGGKNNYKPKPVAGSAEKDKSPWRCFHSTKRKAERNMILYRLSIGAVPRSDGVSGPSGDERSSRLKKV